MNLLPYRRIVLRTKLSKPRAVERLRKGVFKNAPSPCYVRGPMDFIARIDGSHFTANRLLDYRYNGFIPILHGRFVQGSMGTEVHVRLYPPIVNIAIATILGGYPLWLSVRVLFWWLQNGRAPNEALAFLPFSAIIYGSALSMFNPEADRAEDFLRGLYGKDRAAKKA